MSNPFHYPKVKIENSWRSIILLGSNTSCYKFALGKTLLEMNTQKTEILLEDIALPFSKNISQHLLKNKKQTTNPSSSFIDSCKKYNLGEISEDELFGATMKEGFRYVIDAFHKVGKKEVIRFFEDNRKKNKSIQLTDNFYRLLNEDIYGNLSKEVESRWNLWETSISLNTNPNLISLKIDERGKELVLMDLPVTSARDSIIGYQDGRCFYCQKKLTLNRSHKDACEVDHFFPKSLYKEGGIKIFEKLNLLWNLVCACNECNGSGEKSNNLAEIKYLRKLNNRNNMYAETPHPLRESIINQTGETRKKREKFLQKMLDEAAKEKGISEDGYWAPKNVYID